MEWKVQRDHSRAFLRTLIEPGTTIYGQFIWKGKESIVYTFYVISENQIVPISREIGYALPQTIPGRDFIGDGVECVGDDGSMVIRHLAQTLFGDETALSYCKFA